MRLVIIGAGGHGQVLNDVIQSINNILGKDFKVIFLDDRYNTVKEQPQEYGSIKYKINGNCESFADYIDENTVFYPAFGDNAYRLEWEDTIEKAGGKLVTIIHPNAYVASSAVVSPGSVILPNAIVNAGTYIGKGCIINVGAIVEHGCVIADGCHINSGAIVMAENYIPSLTKIESGTIVSVRQYRD